MNHPKDTGDRTTLAVILALREKKFIVSEPFGENARYDLVMDDGDRLSRVQCKTGRLRGGAVLFATCSCYGHHFRPSESRRDYLGEIDFFAVYCHETSGVYLIPVEDVPNRASGALRVAAPRNGQQKRIRFARDYEIARVALDTDVTEVLPASSGAG
jgi:PD-(D/E)XK endonuclease